MKKIIILFIPLLLVGCSANYTLVIDDNEYSETIQIISNNDEEKNSLFSNQWRIPINYDIYSQTDDSDEIGEYEYYKYDKNTNNIEFKYDFNFNEISNSTALKKCFNSARIVKNRNKVIITTDNNNTCFDNDGNMEKIDVSIIVKNKRVISNNADKVIDNKYMWYINTSNYNEKSINLTYEELNESNIISSNDGSRMENNDLLSRINIDKNMIIFCLVFLIVMGISVFIFNKIQKDDQ